jgi:hypothetical protein
MNTCLDCDASLEGRGVNALYCSPCARKREKSCRNNKTLYQSLAMTFVSVAVRHGDLPKLDGSIPCVDCGKPASHYDHRDYKQPLDVAPVCRTCNAQRGPAKHKDPRESGKKPPSILRRFRERERAA